MIKIKYFGSFLLVFLLMGCGANMPTPPVQITGSYVSEFAYKNLDCDRLSIELNALSRREDQLVVAQRQRIKTSRMQAFWRGYGQGDGLEATGLANVRGEKEAILRAMKLKNCKQPAPPAE